MVVSGTDIYLVFCGVLVVRRRLDRSCEEDADDFRGDHTDIFSALLSIKAFHPSIAHVVDRSAHVVPSMFLSHVHPHVAIVFPCLSLLVSSTFARCSIAQNGVARSGGGGGGVDVAVHQAIDEAPVDDGSGDLQIWRVENFKLVAWPKVCCL